MVSLVWQISHSLIKTPSVTWHNYKFLLPNEGTIGLLFEDVVKSFSELFVAMLNNGGCPFLERVSSIP